MPEGQGFKAWISVTSSGNRSKVLQEYRTEVDPQDSTVITTWIPSEAGKEFKVSWKSLETLTLDMSGHVYADGRYIRGKITRSDSKSLTYPSTSPSVVKDVLTRNFKRRRFFFSPLHVTGDPCFLRKAFNVFRRKNKPSTENVGEIKIVIYEVTLGDRIEPDRCTVEVKPIKTVEEKVKKKGIVHGVDFGPEFPDTVNWVGWDVTNRRRVVTFVFKYRPIDVLKAQGTAYMLEKDAEKKK